MGTEIQVRDPRGRIIGRGLTRAGGRFAIDARPVGGGIVRIGVAAGRHLLPRRSSVDVRIEVRPSVGLSASSTAVVAGEQILFSGPPAPLARASWDSAPARASSSSGSTRSGASGDRW